MTGSRSLTEGGVGLGLDGQLEEIKVNARNMLY